MSNKQRYWVTLDGPFSEDQPTNIQHIYGNETLPVTQDMVLVMAHSYLMTNVKAGVVLLTQATIHTLDGTVVATVLPTLN